MDEPPSICRVCEVDNALNHYGSVCCSGCKGFFRRSIRFRKEYSCPRANKCPINKKYRNACRACRLQKCLQAGLNPQLVQGDWGHRVNGTSDVDSSPERSGDKDGADKEEPKFASKKAKFEAEAPAEVANREGTESGTTERETTLLRHNHQMLNAKIAAQRALGFASGSDNSGHLDFNGISQYLVRIERFCDLFVDKPEHCTISGEAYAAYTFNLEVPIQLAYRQPGLICERIPMGFTAGQLTHSSSFARCYSRVLVHYFDWASHLPEFLELPEQDRVILIVRRATRCMYLMLCYRAVLFRTNGIPMSCDRYYPFDPAEQERLEPQLREMFADTIEMAMRELVHPMRELEVAEAEYAVLRALCFFTPVPRLSKEGNRIILGARDKYLAVLNCLVNGTSSNNSSSLTTADFVPANVRRMNRLLLLLSRTEQIAQMDDNTIAMLSAFNIAQMRGNLTYEMHIRDI